MLYDLGLRLPTLTAELVRGSCLEVFKQLNDESIDSFVTDPPYGIDLNLGFGRARPATIRGDGKAEARKLWRDWLPEAYRSAKPDTLHAIFGTWKSPWMLEAITAAGFRPLGCIVWHKRPSGISYWVLPAWEQLFIVAKGKPKRIACARNDVWPIARVLKPQHPCEKPQELLRRCIEMTSLPGALVADPFAGIGSTGVAAVQLGRRFIGAEIDRRHHKLGAKRISDALAAASSTPGP